MVRRERQSSGFRDQLSVRETHGLTPRPLFRAGAALRRLFHGVHALCGSYALGSTDYRRPGCNPMGCTVALDAYHLQRVRMSELANDNFNSERVLCRFARLLRCVPGPRAANRRRQDKANWRSLAPCGRKSLSAHWFLHLARPSERHVARCSDRPREISSFEFQSSERWRS